MKVAIFAILSKVQFEYLQNLASEQGIECRFIVEGDESEITVDRRVTGTPLTGEMLQAAANASGYTVIQVAQQAAHFGITTVEEALAHAEIPRAVKQALKEAM